MTGDEWFDRLPDLFFRSLRRQMLLGMVPSETVEAMLQPLLTDFQEVMPSLPPDVQDDIRHVLKIYPEIAEKYGLKMGYSAASLMRLLWDRLRESFVFDLNREPVFGFTRGGGEDPQKLLHEKRRLLKRTIANLPRTAADFFTTDRGSRVFLEYLYDEEKESVCFRASGTSGLVHLFLCGDWALTLETGEQYRCLTLDGLLDFFGDKEILEMDIELREETDD